MSARPSTSTHQRLSKLDTRFSRFSHHFFLASFLKGVKCRVPDSWPFSLFKNSTLADKIQFTFTSSLCTISSSFWWHTSGEKIDTYGGTNQQQQVYKPYLLSYRVSCMLKYVKLKIPGFTLTNFGFWSWATSSDILAFHLRMNSLCHTAVSFKICLTDGS